MTDTLLILILLSVLAQIVLDWRNAKRLATFLDSMSDGLFDMLRELINKTEGKK